MSQATDYTIDNSTGANVRADINTVLGAIATNNSGGSDNGSIQALGFFANTSTSKLQLKNAAGNAFINLRGFDGTLPLPDGSAANPSLFFDDDPDTGCFSGGANQFQITTGGAQRLKLDGTEVVFNDNGTNTDFRIEGDTNANLLFVDASTDRVGIGTSSPSNVFDVVGTISGSNFLLTATAGTYGLLDDTSIAFFGSTSTGIMQFKTNGNNERMRIDSSGNLGIGTTAPAELLTVNGTDKSAMIRTSNSTGTAKLKFNADDINFAGVGLENTALVFRCDNNSSPTERMRLDSSGRLMIGTTTPQAMLTLDNTGQTTQTLIQCEDTGGSGAHAHIGFKNTTGDVASIVTTGDNLEFRVDDATVFSNLSATEFMRINSVGSVGIGETSPARKLHVSGGTFPALRIKNTSTSIANGTNICGVEFEHADSSAPGVCAGIQAQMADTSQGGLNMLFLTGTNVNLYKENMRLDANGRLLIQETTTADVNANLTVAVGGASLAGIVTHSGTTANRHALACCNDNGHIGGITTSGSTTSFNTSSDYRLKENATAISDGISRLKTLKPYRFNWKVDSSTTVDGFFAHEVTAVPEAITGTKDEVVTQAMIDAGDYEEENLNDPIYQGIDQSKLVPLLVAAVKELITKVEALEAA